MRGLWPGLLAINAAWSLHLLASYFLAWRDCVAPDGVLLVLRHMVTVVALGVTLVAWWRAAHVSAQAPSSAGQSGAAGEATAERAYLARVTLFLSVMFFFAVLLAGAANLFLPPCI